MKRTLQGVGGSAVLLTALTACPGPRPPYVPPVSLNFRFPDTPASPELKLAAIFFEEAATPEGRPKVKVLAGGQLNGDSGATVRQGTLFLDAYALGELKNNAACVTPFVGGEARDMQDVTVTPATVKTCNVYFTLFRDVNNDGVPNSSEELYTTHDLYSYADSAFTYRMTSPDGRSVETGGRAAGWSLVRHEVRQPTATPGQYRVTMNSVPADDEGLTLRLHEDTDPLTSMGLGGPR